MTFKKHKRYSPEVLHLMVEAMRRAFADRAKHLGDSDFVKIPEHLTTKKYAKQLAKEINRKRATKSDALAKEIPLSHEGTSTTHFSIVDRSGMAVSNTYTLEQSLWLAGLWFRGSRFFIE